MIPFKIPKEIGMPYHGLAVDGILAHPTGDKDIEMPDYSGTCKLIRHPLATGPVRNTNQLAHDAANSLEWRDYALMTGASNGINGSQGLGVESWLYCDPGGNTWVVNIVDTNTGGTHRTVELWIKEIFGRFGKDYEITPRLLATLDFVPTIPSWYTGSTTLATLVSRTSFLQPTSINFLPDGSEAYINGYCTNTDTSNEVYEETQPYNITGIYQGFSMIGVLKATITGTGDINNDGAGITATLDLDMEYEVDQIIRRDSYGFGEFTPDPEPTCSVSSTGVPIAPAQDCPAGELTLQWDYEFFLNPVGATSGISGKQGQDYEAVLYKSHYGLIKRTYKNFFETTFDFQYGGQHKITYNLSNCDKGNGIWPGYTTGTQWYVASCSANGGDSLWSQRTTDSKGVQETIYNIYGVEYSHNYFSNNVQRDRNQASQDTCGGTGTGLPCCINGGACPDDPSEFEEIQTATLNGVLVPYSASTTLYNDLRVIGPNLVYVALDHPNPSLTDRAMIETVAVVNEAGVVGQALDMTTNHADLPGPRYMPDTRELVWSYQPVTEESAHAQTTLFIAHSGILYQYV